MTVNPLTPWRCPISQWTPLPHHPPPSPTPTTKPVQHLVQCDLRWPQLSRMHLFHCGRQHLVIPLLSVLRFVFISSTHSSTHTHTHEYAHRHTSTCSLSASSCSFHYTAFCMFCFFSTKTPRSFKCLLAGRNAALLHTIFVFFAEWLIGFSTGVQSVDWLSVHAGHQILVFCFIHFELSFFHFYHSCFFFTTAFHPSHFSKLDLGKTHTLFNITVPMPNTFCSISKFN